ncbi:hypothetical protein EA187_06340 [Lujinxingia sediminis]|uniref:YncE family protein n=1 Tax=Lujinxingia sediminis TaxID=2480984 RepID=A0ABY0CUK4_9DELT|nr:hypothetical protein [Lujinxingia sediminis]RVU46752.1 hypothetical protein EA187_06340 [Lujinxingia sediminis]
MNDRMKVRLLMAAAGCALGISGCGERYEEPLPPRDALYYPIGLELHPSGRFLYVTNSNFDLKFNEEMGGTVSVIDTTTNTILADASPYVPSFAGHIELNEDGTRAYVTSRQQSEVTVLDVASEGQAIFCEVDGQPQRDTRSCVVRRVPDVREGAEIPLDPFGLSVGRVTREVGGESVEFDLVHLSHLQGSEVTSLSFPQGEIEGASMSSAALLNGGNQTRIRPGTQDVYVAGRFTNVVAMFQPFVNEEGKVEAIVRRGSVELSRAVTQVDARGLAFNAAGDRLYVAARNPGALFVVGIDETNGLRHEVIDTIPLEPKASGVVVHQGADGVERVYVSSYRNGIIQVVEPQLGAVVDIIDVGRSPYDMVIDPSPAYCNAPGDRCQAYVSLFDQRGDQKGERCDDDDKSCGAIAVIDLDPASETFHQVIDHIQ